MNKRKLLPAVTMIAGAVLAAPASAAVHIEFLQGTSVSSLSGYTVINSFDSTAGITGSGFLVQNVSNGNGAKIPLPDSLGTNYLSILGGGVANLILPTATSDFAFEWGSLDTYNTVTINLGDGSSFILVPSQNVLSGSPGNGNQIIASTNGTVRVYGDAGELFAGLNLQSAVNSLEFDNLAIKAAIPETATWAMMIAGLGAAGFSLRRRKTAAVRFA
ncbi:MAG TPA: PEPxxWA-CTERM sorting domain-containing protein [Sphingobium sp.]